jgi:hypothetical protein
MCIVWTTTWIWWSKFFPSQALWEKLKIWYKICMHICFIHHKFSMQWINNINHAKFLHLLVCTFSTQISFIENTFDTRINVLINEIQTYEWMNVTRITQFFINLSVECVFNAQYQCANVQIMNERILHNFHY